MGIRKLQLDQPTSDLGPDDEEIKKICRKAEKPKHKATDSEKSEESVLIFVVDQVVFVLVCQRAQVFVVQVCVEGDELF